MDVNYDQNIDKKEFIDFMTKAFKNYEDNIEFLSNDIKAMDEKIEEVVHSTLTPNYLTIHIL